MNCKCARCKKPIRGTAESCWYCLDELCASCWDEFGHCGHEEAELINRLGQAVSRNRGTQQSLGELLQLPTVKLRALVALAEARS